MATVVSTPAVAYLATIMAYTSNISGGASAVSVTATFGLLSGWEIQLPLRASFATVSADPPVNVYRSTDGGANFDTVPLTSISIARVASGFGQASISLPTGYYAVVFAANISAVAGCAFTIPTAVVITAAMNV